MKYKDIKKTIRYRFFRFIWVKARDLSSVAGKKCISMLQKAEENS